ncbi:putative RNA-directed DNA polymerase from transposon BS [Trichonephila clavipes]|uniref:Putative RNA-directed DNA polymerase from transposon BS n=1 Tax=Trichonephila clavipes TaxID=2585209 RepID=A0A8X6R8T3_TRICX|nr:putative RNA-directed DNA polymerase from transposon BS [Trichonephila clavipes]
MSRLTFTRQAKLAVHKCRSSDLGEPVFLADFSMLELLLVLNVLDSKKSPGQDNIHKVMITHLRPRGIQRLLDIFNNNQFWKSGRLPHEWKRATIIPIRKPGQFTYTTLIRPVLEFGSAIFFIASDSNLKKLERLQLSAARIIAGLRNSCPNNLVLYECDLQPLNMRRNYCLTKYFNKLLRTELIAIICGLSFINNIRDLAVSEIWILTDSRSSIQHLSNWPSIGDSTSRSILHLFQQLSDQHPIHLQWVLSHVGLLGNEVADNLAKAATRNPVDPENHMVLTSTEIYSRAK